MKGPKTGRAQPYSLKRFFLSYEKRNGKLFPILKHEKLHLQISSSIVHKNDLFLDLNVHYLSKKQSKADKFLKDLRHKRTKIPISKIIVN